MKIKTQQLSKPVKTYADNGGDIPVGLNRFCKAKAAAGSQPVGKSIAGGDQYTAQSI